LPAEKPPFDYDALLVRIAEQAARVLPYFDEGSQERAQMATHFKQLEHHLREAQKPFPEPRLERYHMDKAFDELVGLEAHLRDASVPTDVEATLGRAMQPIWARHGELMEQYPSLEDKLAWHEYEQSQKVNVPEEWTQRLVKKVREESENPTMKRSH
jgi:hypothetical protein